MFLEIIAMEMNSKDSNALINELYKALLLIKNKEEMARFMKDLCTPQELKALAERWNVCRLLEESPLSYREIHALTGVSLATITRIARFLNTEPHQGYKMILNRFKKSKLKDIRET